MWEKVKFDIERCGNKFTFISFIKLVLINAGFRAVFVYRLSSSCRRQGFRFLAAFFERVNHHLCHCWISSSADIGPGFSIRHVSGIIIGSKVVVGSNFEIRQNITLGGNNQKIIEGRTQPLIGDNVTVGCTSSILGPVKIGDNVFVGAHSLVLSDCQSNSVYAGVPAKKIRDL